MLSICCDGHRNVLLSCERENVLFITVSSVPLNHGSTSFWFVGIRNVLDGKFRVTNDNSSSAWIYCREIV